MEEEEDTGGASGMDSVTQACLTAAKETMGEVIARNGEQLSIPNVELASMHSGAAYVDQIVRTVEPWAMEDRLIYLVPKRLQSEIQ